MALSLLKDSPPEFEEMINNMEQELQAQGWTVLRFSSEGRGDNLLWPYWQVQIVLGLAVKTIGEEKPSLKFFYSTRTTTESLALIATLVKNLNKKVFNYALGSALEHFWHFDYRKFLNAAAIPTVIIEFNSSTFTSEIVDELKQWLISALLSHIGTCIEPPVKVPDALTEPEPEIICPTGEAENITPEIPLPPINLHLNEALSLKNEEVEVKSEDEVVTTMENELPSVDEQKTPMDEGREEILETTVPNTQQKLPPPLPVLKTSNKEEIKKREAKRESLKRRRYLPNPFASPAGEPVYRFAHAKEKTKSIRFYHNKKPLSGEALNLPIVPIVHSTFLRFPSARPSHPGCPPAPYLPLKELAAIVTSKENNFSKPEKL